MTTYLIVRDVDTIILSASPRVPFDCFTTIALEYLFRERHRKAETMFL